MNKGELLSFLNRNGSRPKKSLSQNFLIDANIVRKIVQTAQIVPGDLVLEIGPGPGALTRELLSAGATVYAVEMDTVFAAELSRFQTADQRLHVFEADFLQFDLKKLPSPLKIVANLPYHITTPILERLFERGNFLSITVMVQKEVAVRMGAKEGSKDFGSLSLFVQFYSSPKTSFLVPPGCFFPEPGVDSTVIHLNSRTPPTVDRSSFFQLVHRAFQQRRKMMTSSLKELVSAERVRETLSKIGVRPDARPEALSLGQWVALVENICLKKSLTM